MRMAIEPRRCDLNPDDGLLRALADGEGADGWHADLEAHVRQCESCRERSQAVRATAALARGRLLVTAAPASLSVAPPLIESILRPAAVPWPTRVVRAIGPLPGTWATRAGAVAAAVVIAAAWPAVSSFAEGTLQSLRVQRVQPITIQMEALGSRMPLGQVDDAKLREAVRYRGTKAPTLTITTQADAVARSGLPLRLPSTVPAAVSSKPARFVVASLAAAEMKVDGPRLVQVARDAKVTDDVLLGKLGALDGADIKVETSPAVVAIWGDVDLPTQGGSGGAVAVKPAAGTRGPALFVGQMRSPVVTVPGSVDLDGLRDAALKSGSIPPPIARALAAITDWRTTLPVPVVGREVRAVSVDGTTASMFTATDNGRPVTVVWWVKDGIIHGVVGELPEADVLAVARSLKPARS